MIQGLAAFLKAIGFLIPLMDAEYASYYTREVMLILIREFASPDEEMKKIVLKVHLYLLLYLFEYWSNIVSTDALVYRFVFICALQKGTLPTVLAYMRLAS